MSSIFISHSSADNSFAQELERRLAHQNHHSVFLDLDPEKGIVAGKSWEQTLYRKLRACRAVIAICTENYLSSHWCFAEIALARMEGKEILALQADPLSPNSKMPSILTEKQFIDLRHNQEEGYERLWKGLRAMDMIGTDGEWDPRRPPYLGLNAYDEDDAGVFFGREEETATGLELLSRGAPNLIMILGASGSGKSSMVRAGIVPRLRQDPKQWLIVDPFRPAKDPFIELAQSLADTVKQLAPDQLGRIGDWERIRDRLAAGQELMQRTREAASECVLGEDGRLSRLLGQLEDLRARPPAGVQGQLTDFLNWTVEDLMRICAGDAGADVSPDASTSSETVLTAITDELRRVCGRRNARVLLVIDQFEEMLGEDTRDTNASSFLAMLRASIEDDPSALMVLGTMRSDFLGVFQRHPALQGVDFESLSLGPMKLDGMRRVIEEPAKLGAIELETGLPDRLLEDTATSDALPLLSFTLWVLWRDYRDDGKLDLSEYGQLGGLDGAVAGEANALLASARHEGKEQALRDAFLRMVRITETGSYARRSAPWDAKELQPVHEILERFVDRRLLVSRAEGEARLVEVAHEALFRSWQPLKIWLDNHRAELLLKEQIRRDAETWNDQGRARDNLWRGGRLQQAIEMLDKGKIDGLQGEFVRSGLRRKQGLRRTVVATTAAVIAVLAGLLGVASWQWNKAKNRAIAAEATLLWSPIDREPNLSVREVEGLFTLARDKTEVKRAFARHLKDDAALAEKFSRQPKAITRALAGLDTDERGWLIQELLIPSMPKEAAVQAALGFLAAALEAGEGIHHLLEAILGTAYSDPSRKLPEALAALAAKLPPAQAEPAADKLVAAIKDTTDPDQLEVLAKALAALAARLPPAQAESAVDKLVVAIKDTNNSFQLEALAMGLAALPVELPPAQAESVADKLVVAIKDTTDSDQLRALAQALATLAAKLPPAQAKPAADKLVAAIKYTTDPDQLRALAMGLAALPVELTPAQAVPAADKLVAAIEDTAHPNELRALAKALAALPVELTPVQAKQAADKLVAVIKDTAHPNELRALAEALAALPVELTPAQAVPAADKLVAAIEDTAHPNELRALAEALAALPVELTPAQAKQAADKLVAVIKVTAHPYLLWPLAMGLAALPVELTPAQAESAVDKLVVAIKDTTDPDQLEALAMGLAALAARLTPAQAESAVDKLVVAIKDTNNSFQLEALAMGLAALPVELPPAQAESVADKLVVAIKDTTDSDQLRALAKALAALAARLTPAQAESAVDKLVAAIKDTTDPYQLEALAQALAALPVELTPAQTKPAADKLVAAIKDTTDPRQLRALAQALAVLPVELPPAQAEPAADKLVAAIKETTNSFQLEALAQALAVLPVELTPAQTKPAADKLVAAIKDTTDPRQLRALAEALAVLPVELPPAQAEPAADKLVAAIKDTTHPYQLEALAQALAALADKLTDDRGFAALVFEVIKYPNITEVRLGEDKILLEDILLESVRTRFKDRGAPAKEKGFWAMVKWAKKKFPDLDLKSPPKKVLSRKREP